jgi:hypothetical protein
VTAGGRRRAFADSASWALPEVRLADGCDAILDSSVASQLRNLVTVRRNERQPVGTVAYAEPSRMSLVYGADSVCCDGDKLTGQDNVMIKIHGPTRHARARAHARQQRLRRLGAVHDGGRIWRSSCTRVRAGPGVVVLGPVAPEETFHAVVGRAMLAKFALVGCAVRVSEPSQTVGPCAKRTRVCLVFRAHCRSNRADFPLGDAVVCMCLVCQLREARGKGGPAA